MKYKVGDKVRIRKDLKATKSYGGLYFNSRMEQLRGNLVTIRMIDEPSYCIKGSDDFWNDEMFEPVITNWDKVKEEIDINEAYSTVDCVCNAIKRVRNVKHCDVIPTCRECHDWLLQPYKEPSILDEAEKKYLSAVIRPWRDKVENIEKNRHDKGEFIMMELKGETMSLPYFKANTMYKGMELNKEYTLDELGL